MTPPREDREDLLDGGAGAPREAACPTWTTLLGTANAISFPSGKYRGNVAFRSTNVGSPPVTGTDHTSHVVAWEESRGGRWKITLRPSGLKFIHSSYQYPAESSRFVICVL